MHDAVLILGGYGNFGKRIAARLVQYGIPVIIAGRDQAKAEALHRQLASDLVSVACFDAQRALKDALSKYTPRVVINTCGPYQTSDYAIAQTCIDHTVHYIDLADARRFVRDITTLDDAARQNNVSVISGASSVPGLSSAVLDHYKHEFSKIESLDFGISPGQKAERGLATTQAIFSYVGRPLEPYAGFKKQNYGWQDLHRQHYPGLGYRWLANCDIPDLDLLPDRYGIGSIRFSAGLELGMLHLGLWGLSWLIRLGLPIDLPRLAKPMLAASNIANGLGSADGGMHVVIKGHDHNNQTQTRSWFIIARDGDGPYIPTVPAIVLTRQLLNGSFTTRGALPCVGLVTLDDYLDELKDKHIDVMTDLA